VQITECRCCPRRRQLPLCCNDHTTTTFFLRLQHNSISFFYSTASITPLSLSSAHASSLLFGSQISKRPPITRLGVLAAPPPLPPPPPHPATSTLTALGSSRALILLGLPFPEPLPRFSKGRPSLSNPPPVNLTLQRRLQHLGHLLHHTAAQPTIPPALTSQACANTCRLIYPNSLARFCRPKS
jgi:hypothetical protein